MGATNFLVFGKAETARAAFDALVEDAAWEHGHDPYNGTISTTVLRGEPVKVADKWCGEAHVLAEKEAEANDWGNKWESRAIDCGDTGDGDGTRMWAFYGWAAM